MFSDEPEFADELWAVRKVKRQPQWLNPLLAGTNLERNWGRPRSEGRWALAFMAFVVSRHPDVEPWWATSRAELWAECGFAAKPSHQITWQRSCELESVSEAFTGVANMLIQHGGRRSGGKVGWDTHVDATEAESNARLRHDCREGESCARAHRRRSNPEYPKRVSAEDARATRHSQAAQAPSEDELDIGDATEMAYDEEHHVTRVRIGGCW